MTQLIPWIKVGVVLVVFVIVVWTTCLNALRDDMSPIAAETLPTFHWKKMDLDRESSATCVMNFNGYTWILGGKELHTNNDVSSSARILQFNTTLLPSTSPSSSMYRTIRTDIQLNKKIKYFGSSFPIDGLYCSSPHLTAYVVNKEATPPYVSKVCVISANDGIRNFPRSHCCDNVQQWFQGEEERAEAINTNIENINTNTNNTDTNKKAPLRFLVCSDLWEEDQTPPLFDSCIINDVSRERVIQIGGSSGVRAYDTILCMNMTSEKYSRRVHTVASLEKRQDSGTHDEYCPYTHLAMPIYGSGCAMANKSNALLVIGGRRLNEEPEDSFSNAIQICRTDGEMCKISKTLRLPEGAAHTTVIMLDEECIFLTLGGSTRQGINQDIWIGNLCTEKWLYHGVNVLPEKLVEFGVSKSDTELCIIGGIVKKPGDFSMSKYAYCLSLDIFSNLVKNTQQCEKDDPSCQIPSSITTATTATTTTTTTAETVRTIKVEL